MINLRSLDADSTREGLQAFTWIGDQSFTPSTPGQLRYRNGVVSADLNGDLRADFALEVLGSPALTAANFLL